MGQGYDSYLVIGNQCNGMGSWGVGSFAPPEPAPHGDLTRKDPTIPPSHAAPHGHRRLLRGKTAT